MFGFLPFGHAATRVHQAWLQGFRGIDGSWLAATGANLASERTFLDRRTGLAFEAKCEHLFGEDFADLDDEVFELRQFGAPGGSFGSPETIRQVFGDAFNIGARFFHLLTPLFGACHPWLPVRVKANSRTDSPR
jgi:hypothetical protein